MKYLNLRSQLGWHGDSLQKMQIESAEMEQIYNEYIGPIRAKEMAFFQKIKVQQASTIVGQAPHYDQYQHCVGWRYTREKMRSFGIDRSGTL